MKNLLSQIVRSYELPPLLEQRVMGLASRGVQYHSLHSPDEMYTYVDRLVNRFKERYEERGIARLDHPLRNNDGRTLSEIVADSHLPTDETTPEYQIAKAAFDGKLQVVLPLLSSAERKILLSLLENSSHHYISGEVMDDIDALRERLDIVNRIAQEDKRFLQPERPIVAVHLDPENPYVQWGSRNYDGDPAAYRDRHIKVYGAMSRNELAAFDPGLYHALLRKGQMGMIPRRKRIPKVVPVLSLDDRRRIISVYETNHSPRAIAENTGLAEAAVKRVLRVNGLDEQQSVHSSQRAKIVLRVLSEFEFSGGDKWLAYSRLKRERVGRMALRHIARRNGLE